MKTYLIYFFFFIKIKIRMSFNVLLKIYHLQNVSIMFLPAVKFISFYSTLPCSAAAVWIKYYFRVSLSNFFFFSEDRKSYIFRAYAQRDGEWKGWKKSVSFPVGFYFFLKIVCLRRHVSVIIIILIWWSLSRPCVQFGGRRPCVRAVYQEWIFHGLVGGSPRLSWSLFFILWYFFFIFLYYPPPRMCTRNGFFFPPTRNIM